MTSAKNFIFFLLAFSVFNPLARAQDNLTPFADQIMTQIQDKNWSNDNCVATLVTIQNNLDQMSSAANTRDQLKALAPNLIDKLWKIRLALHDRLAGANDECAKEIRNSFRQFRFIEDYLGEIELQPKEVDVDTVDFSKQPVPIDEPNEAASGYLLQKVDPNFDFQPGDVVIARGVSFLSAMIARLGDTDSQFSHVILVTEDPNVIDPKTNKHRMQTIESYVGVGVAIYDRTTALQNSNARLLVLRPKDQDLAKKASEQMRAYVASRTGANKIYYDYALDFTDHTTMSCAEVAQVAFLNASNGAFNLPERQSTLTHGLDLVEHLGIKPGNTFTPGDLEGDSRFDIVAEWRDLRTTRDSRLKDAIMTKIISWMDDNDFYLHDTLKSKMAHGLIWDARHSFLWPVVKKALGVADFSKEIPRDMVGTVELIGELGDGMLKELKRRDDLQIQQTGLSMTYLELYDTLEDMRTQDEVTFFNKKTRKNSIILKYLRSWK